MHTLYNFKWQPTSSGINYNRLGNNTKDSDPKTQLSSTFGPPVKDPGLASVAFEQKAKQLVNHVEHHALLTEKFNLLHVLQRYSDANKENVFDTMPVTFYVEISDPNKEQSYQAAIYQFAQLYQVLE